MSEPNLEETRSKRLKILHIAGWYPSRKNPVAGVFVREHVKATALYNDVIVLYSDGIDTSIKHFYEIDNNVEDGIRTLRLRYRKSPIPKTSYFIYLWAIFRAFRKLAKEGFLPDIIHAHVYSAGVPAVLLGKWYGIPVVISEHFSGFPRGLVRGLERMKAKFAFERAAFVCPVSNDLRKHIEHLGIKARFQVIPNVVDTSLFFPVKGHRAREGNQKSLLVVALLTPIKGIPYLLEALARLREQRKDFVLDIVGDGSNRAEYEELARKLGLQDIVRFHGLKTKQEVAEFMRQADMLVLPSIWENMPCVLIEAMASGLPILSTTVGGIPEIVDDKVGLLVPPADIERLVEALGRMLDICNRFDRAATASRAQQYGLRSVGKMLQEVYQACLGI